MTKQKIWYEVFCRRCGTFSVSKKDKKRGVNKCRRNDKECPILKKK